MSKLKINFNFATETYIIGISSDEKIYRLCWLFNQSFNLNLKFSHFHLLNTVTKEGFATYKTIYLGEHSLYLLSSKHEHNHISQKYSLFDFFIICDTLDEDELSQLSSAINTLADIKMAKTIEITHPKEVELFYIEP